MTLEKKERHCIFWSPGIEIDPEVCPSVLLPFYLCSIIIGSWKPFSSLSLVVFEKSRVLKNSWEKTLLSLPSTPFSPGRLFSVILIHAFLKVFFKKDFPLSPAHEKQCSLQSCNVCHTHRETKGVITLATEGVIRERPKTGCSGGMHWEASACPTLHHPMHAAGHADDGRQER